MKSRAKWGCLGVVVAIAGIALFAYQKVRTPPQVGSDAVPFVALPKPEQARRRVEAKQLTEQVRGLGQSAQRKEHRPFRLTATEEQLNTLLQDRVQSDRSPVRDLKAGLTPGELGVQGKVDYKGFHVVATLTGTVAAQHGKLVYTAQSLLLGGIDAPHKLKQQVEKLVSGRLNRLLGTAPVKINSVEVEKGRITIQGVTD